MISRLSYINTKAALEDASNFANQILSSKINAGSSVSTVHHDHYHWGSGWGGWSGWGYYPQPVYCGGSRESSRNEKKDHAWIAIPATIIALATMYFIGQNHAEWSQSKEGIANLQQKYRVVRTEVAHKHPALRSTVQSVFEKQRSILDRIRSDASTGLILKSIFATSVIVAGIGGLASGGMFFPETLSHLIGYSSLSAFIAGCVMLYRVGFNSKDTQIQAEAQELQIAVHRAARVLDEVARV